MIRLAPVRRSPLRHGIQFSIHWPASPSGERSIVVMIACWQFAAYRPSNKIPSL